MTESSWENRTFERLPKRIDTPFVDMRSGRFIHGRTRDVSEGGVFIEADEHPPVGSLVDLFIGGVGIGTQVVGRIVRAAGDGFGAKFTGHAAGIKALIL